MESSNVKPSQDLKTSDESPLIESLRLLAKMIARDVLSRHDPGPDAAHNFHHKDDSSPQPDR
jgi:hypothetical protein